MTRVVHMVQARRPRRAVAFVFVLLLLVMASWYCAGCDKSDEKKLVNTGESTFVTQGFLTVACAANTGSLDVATGLELDENGNEVAVYLTPTGFEAELINLLAAQMGLQVAWNDPVYLSTLCDVVGAGTTADVAISSIPVTEDSETVAFTDGYRNAVLGVYVLEETGSGITSADQLATAIIGVQKGSGADTWATNSFPKAAIGRFDSTKALFAALRAGKVDAVVADVTLEGAFIGTIYNESEYGLTVEFLGTTVSRVDTVSSEVQYGIAVNANNEDLVTAINKALDNIKKDGSFDELYSRYYSE